MLRFLFFLLCLLPPAWAQTDSVTISGRIRNLTPRLYRQSPNVLISRNNLLQPNAELTRPAPLNPDGTYAIRMPILFPQEEMYVSFGAVSTAFLAAPGTVVIHIDADSLFRAAIPFTFDGVNARVNSQYARYKAFEVKQAPIDFERLSRQASGQDLAKAFSWIQTAYGASLERFSRVEKPFPLVAQWITNVNRYNTAAFLYDVATAEGRLIPRSLDDSLRPANDPILTAARTVAGGQLAAHVAQLSTQSGSTLPVNRLATLLLRYGRNLTDEERAKLREWQSANSARASDLRYAQRLMQRNPDTLQRLATYETLADKARMLVDTPSVELVMANWLARTFATSNLQNTRLLYAYARPQLSNGRVVQSLRELYGLAVGDSARIEKAIRQIKPGATDNAELTTGIFITQREDVTGAALLDRWLTRNRSRLIYVLVWSMDDEANRRSAALAQRLRDQYDPSELTLLYVATPDKDTQRLYTYLIRNNLLGDHLVLNNSQYEGLLGRLGAANFTGAYLLNYEGRVIRANTLLPDDNVELTKLIDKRLNQLKR